MNFRFGTAVLAIGVLLALAAFALGLAFLVVGFFHVLLQGVQ